MDDLFEFPGDKPPVPEPVPECSHPFIWYGPLPKAWKRQVQSMCGTKVADDCHVAFRVFGPGLNFSPDYAFLRLTRQQAMFAKLASADPRAAIVSDHSGKLWADLASAASKGKADNGFGPIAVSNITRAPRMTR